MSVASVEKLLLLAEIRELIERCAVCLDEQDFEAWPDFFTDEARYRVQSLENHSRDLPHAPIYCDGKGMLIDRVSATRVLVFEARQQRRLVFHTRVTEAAEPAFKVSSSFVLYEAMMDRAPIVAMTGRFFDEVVRTDAGLRFRDRLCVYDNDFVVQNLIFPI